MGYLLSIIVFQAVFTLLILFLTKSHKALFERILVVLVLLLSAHFSVKLVFLTYFQGSPDYYTLPTSFSLMYGPMLFILTAAAYKKINLKYYLLHLLPFLIMTVLYGYLIVQLHDFRLKNNLILPYYNKLVLTELVSPIVYPIINFIRIKKQQQHIHPLRLQLLRSLNVMVIGLPVLSLLFLLVASLFHLDYNVRFVYVFMLLMVVAIAIYKLKLREYELLKLTKQPKMVTQEVVKTKEPKYNSSTLNAENLDAYEAQLSLFFSKQKPYLDPDLTLQKLSAQCNIPKHHLTQVLNTRLEKNFYQYVNEYRIQEVINAIAKDQQSAIVDIAYQCGFNSKSTFNTYFKKITGLTPSAFKKQQNLIA